jgi:hypothetical protein
VLVEIAATLSPDLRGSTGKQKRDHSLIAGTRLTHPIHLGEQLYAAIT